MKHLKIKIDKLEFSDKEVLKNIEFTLNENDKIAIVWPNWAGKTSFFKLLVWENENYDWFIENVWGLSLWYLNQIYSDNENKTVKEELKLAFEEVLKLDEKLKFVALTRTTDPSFINII